MRINRKLLSFEKYFMKKSFYIKFHKNQYAYTCNTNKKNLVLRKSWKEPHKAKHIFKISDQNIYLPVRQPPPPLSPFSCQNRILQVFSVLESSFLTSYVYHIWTHSFTRVWLHPFNLHVIDEYMTTHKWYIELTLYKELQLEKNYMEMSI